MPNSLEYATESSAKRGPGVECGVKLLLVSHSPGLLGAERSLLEIVSEAAMVHGYEVVVAIPGPGPLADACVRAGAIVRVHKVYSWMGPHHTVWPLGGLRVIQILQSLRSDRRLLMAARPDIVITNTSLTPGLAIMAKRMGLKHVWIVRESIGSNPQLRSLLSKGRIVRLIVRNSDAVCAVSSFVSSQLRELYGADFRIELVRPRPAGNISRYDKPGRSGREFRILLTGFFSDEKGQELAVRALKIAKERSPWPIQMRLVGRGSKVAVARLRALIWTLGLRADVKIIGWTDEVDAHYGWADAVLMLSANEAYGRVTAEALLRSLPVLAVDMGATPELLAEGGGDFVRRRSPSLLAEKIVEWASMSDAAWKALRVQAFDAGERLRNGPTQFQQLNAVVASLCAPQALL